MNVNRAKQLAILRVSDQVNGLGCKSASRLLLLTTHEAAWYIISVVSVCLSVKRIIFEYLDVRESYLHIMIYLQGIKFV